MGCIMKLWFAAAATVVLLSQTPASALEPAAPASVPAPAFTVGDSWIMEVTAEAAPSAFSRRRISQTVERLNSDSMVVAIKVVDAPTAAQNRVVSLDWGQRMVVDGEEKSTQHPLSFPLRVGESWTADWVDPTRHGNQLKVHVHTTYKVVGWEDVTVPAGTFHALKIENNGSADADILIPSVAQSTAVGGGGSGTAVSHAQAGGRGVMHRKVFSLIYYVPEVKQMIKTVDEQYNESEVMTGRTTEELVSFKPAG